MEPKVAIIDADSIIWTTAYFNRDNDDVNFPLLDAFLTEMLTNVEATEYVGYVSNDVMTIRRATFEAYKKNRPPRPEWFNKHRVAIHWHLYHVWQFTMASPGYEADDAVASAAAKLRGESKMYVICGIDKDLLQIPGEHYNYSKKKTQTISEDEALYNLFRQTLIGDTTDNIGGCPGVGPARAEKLLDYLPNPRFHTYCDIVCKQFTEKLGERAGIAKFAETYLLVRLKEDLPIELQLNKYEYNRTFSSSDREAEEGLSEDA